MARTPKSVIIVGGGISGLSTAFALLEQAASADLPNEGYYKVSKKGDGEFHALLVVGHAIRADVHQLVGDRSQGMWISTFHSACVRILRREAPCDQVRRACMAEPLHVLRRAIVVDGDLALLQFEQALATDPKDSGYLILVVVLVIAALGAVLAEEEHVATLRESMSALLFRIEELIACWKDITAPVLWVFGRDSQGTGYLKDLD